MYMYMLRTSTNDWARLPTQKTLETPLFQDHLIRSRMDSPSVQFVSDFFIQPRHAVEESKKPIYLPPWDLAMLSVHYIQKGHLFAKPQEAYTQKDFMQSFLDKLKESLALALVHFYLLAGRFKTVKSNDPHFYTICIDCLNSPGARFIQATLDMTVSEILSPVYVPPVIQSFFDHDRVVTELVDGVFIGCSFNHVLGDGTSFWNFFNAWSEIFKAREKGSYNNAISRPPVLRRWFPEGCEIPINLPFSDPSEFVFPYEAPVLKERVFHFSAETTARLKTQVNGECETKGKGDEISSFKALTALVWRMCPPGLPPDYFGNCITAVTTYTTTGELLGGGLGAAAWLLHVAVAEHDGEKINEWHREWLRKPAIYNLRYFDPYSVMMGSSPRFTKYGPEFGLGKAVALRSGYAHKFDGKVSAYPGWEGGGSVDLEFCLPPETMAALEADNEFMAAVAV
ncbi:hypothetical protein CRG98_009869 [Punica granatum]|uniref:Uncharacterized protein n=1 Tax=Punica granatum TaxID=22663 RepID=A0A2I0KN40_PUNGR|nr:hypothetical protein CRG98_009869 [Punica granatum]